MVRVDGARRGFVEGERALISSAWSRMPRSSGLVIRVVPLLAVLPEVPPGAVGNATTGAKDELAERDGEVAVIVLLLAAVVIPLPTSLVSGEVALTVSVWEGLRSTQEWSGDDACASDNEQDVVRGGDEALTSIEMLLLVGSCKEWEIVTQHLFLVFVRRV